jgi:hypothetical protein
MNLTINATTKFINAQNKMEIGNIIENITKPKNNKRAIKVPKASFIL